MDKYFIGQGKLYAAQRDSNGNALGFLYLGNCSALRLRVGKGGTRYIADGKPFAMSGSMPTFSYTLESFTKENLASALYAFPSTVAAGTAEETIKAYAGKTVPLPHLQLIAFSGLTDTTGTTTYVEDADYSVNMRNGSLSFGKDTTIPDGSDVVASYTHDQFDVIDAFTASPPDVWLRFEGLNSADDNAPMNVDIFKAKLPPMDDLTLIGDNPSTMEMSGEMQYDALRSVGSKLFRITQA